MYAYFPSRCWGLITRDAMSGIVNKHLLVIVDSLRRLYYCARGIYGYTSHTIVPNFLFGTNNINSMSRAHHEYKTQVRITFDHISAAKIRVTYVWCMYC